MAAEKAFVVMQVGAKESPERKRADEVYDFIVRPALEARGLTPYRADLDPSPGGVTAKMLSELLNARLVIADLTGRNPNVFYELGITHSFARAVICIVDSVSALPFDTKDQRVIELGTYAESGLTYAQGEAAKESLAKSLDVVLADGYIPPTPVREVAGSQSLDRLAPENPVASELASIRETLGELRSLVVNSTSNATPSEQADFRIMTRLILSWVNDGRVGPEDLAAAEEGPMSIAMREWWASLSRTAVRRMRANQTDPWSAVKSDEPPF